MNNFIASIALLAGVVLLANTVDTTQLGAQQRPSQLITDTNQPVESGTASSWAYGFVVWNGGHTYKVIPEAKLPKSKIGEQAGVVKRQLNDSLSGDDKNTQRADGDSNLPVGTKIHQFKYGASKGVLVVEQNGDFLKAVKIR